MDWRGRTMEGMSMIRVRFHLGRGKHYQHWQIRHPDGRVEYADPGKVCLYLGGCRLRNHRSTAKRIHAGADKKVCAWVDARYASILPIHAGESAARLPGESLAFNPRVAPHWTDSEGRDIDGMEYDSIATIGRSLRSVRWSG